MTFLMIAALGMALVILLVLIFGTFFTVEQQTCELVERFGKFVRVARAGLNVKIPLIESVAGSVSLRVIQLDVPVETKTLDNVFVNVKISVQYRVLVDAVYDAFYKLANAEEQIRSFVFDTVRAEVPKIKLDEVFVKKEDIANAVERELGTIMSQFGYEIVKALVTDIEPDAKVKAAMNAINAAERERVAAEQQGEAQKILTVKAAEADAESKRLHGVGVGDQRLEIAKRLKTAVETCKQAGVNAEEAMQMVLMTMYLDTLKEIGANSKTNTIFIPSGANGIGEFSKQMMAALQATKGMQEPEPVAGKRGV